MPALFVYGTLRPGGHNFGLLDDAVSHVELAHADGLALYATRGFPYATPDPAPHARITGTLCWVVSQAWPTVLTRLDMLEGYEPDREDTSHYLRRRWLVITDIGRQVDAWLYLAGPHVNLTLLPRIPGGDWLHQPAATPQTTH